MNNYDLPQNEIDVDSLVFAERYVTNLLKLDLLAFFGNNPDLQKNALDIASHLGCSYKSVRSELGDLTMLELLQKSTDLDQPVYRLTTNHTLRTRVIEFAKNRVSLHSNN